MTVHEWLKRRGALLCFTWGFAEATLFFVVPDVAVAAVALFAPERKLQSTLAALCGALAGGTAVYLAGARAGERAVWVLDKVPGTPSHWFERVASDLRGRGGWAVVAGGFSGIPYKIYAVEMGLEGFAWAPAVLWTTLARAARIGPVAAAAASAGRRLRPLIQRRPRAVLVLYGAAWTAFYAAYFSRVGFLNSRVATRSLVVAEPAT